MKRRSFITAFLAFCVALPAAIKGLFFRLPKPKWNLEFDRSREGETWLYWKDENSELRTEPVNLKPELTFRERYNLAMEKGPVTQEEWETPGFFGPKLEIDPLLERDGTINVFGESDLKV